MHKLQEHASPLVYFVQVVAWLAMMWYADVAGGPGELGIRWWCMMFAAQAGYDLKCNAVLYDMVWFHLGSVIVLWYRILLMG